jgi:hypothetical protein
MWDGIGNTKVNAQEDTVFPVTEMVARVIKALADEDEGENQIDRRDHKLLRQFVALRKHLSHPAYQGALPVCRGWIRPLGLEASILLAYVIEQNHLYLGSGRTTEGFFELDDDQIEFELCIDKANLQKMLEILRVDDLLTIRVTTDEEGNPKTLCRVNPRRVKAKVKAFQLNPYTH